MVSDMKKSTLFEDKKHKNYYTVPKYSVKKYAVKGWGEGINGSRQERVKRDVRLVSRKRYDPSLTG